MNETANNQKNNWYATFATRPPSKIYFSPPLNEVASFCSTSALAIFLPTKYTRMHDKSSLIVGAGDERCFVSDNVESCQNCRGFKHLRGSETANFETKNTFSISFRILLRKKRLKVLLSNFKINIVVHAFWAAHDFQIAINIFMHL